MLQQTQVATVIPYFERFLETFPTVESLATADEQTVLSHWEGLGYYRRARSMHLAAKQIVAEHGGKFPESLEDVLALPGIGRYTAGAILSIALDQRQPILEGNTQRVFSRWVALHGNPAGGAASKLLWQIAAAMLPRKNPGSFNQAAMELGALICTPKNPGCHHCPIAGLCSAERDGLQAKIPGTVSRVDYQPRVEFAFVFARRSCGHEGREMGYLIRPLPDGRRWAGLWDFPRTRGDSVGTVMDAVNELSEELRAGILPGTRITTIKHAVTKYRISLHIHEAKFGRANVAIGEPWRYVTLEEMERLPMSVTARRIVTLLKKDAQPRLPL